MNKILVIACLSMMMALFLVGCGENVTLYKEAQKQHDAGEYVVSFYSAAKSLQKKPSYEKALLLMDEVYPLAIAYHEDRIEQLMKSDNPNKFGLIDDVYKDLERIHSTAKKLPTLFNPKTNTKVTFAYKDYSAASNEAKQNAAENHYQNGMKLKNEDDSIYKQKSAAKEFSRAMGYVSDYKDSRMHYEQCRRLGTTRIAIMPFTNDSGTRNSYGALENILVDKIISNVTNTPGGTEFLQLITRSQIDAVISEQKLSASGLVDESSAASVGNLLGAHEIISGKINQVISYPIEQNATAGEESKRVIVDKREYIDSNGKKKTENIYGDIICKFDTINYKKKMVINGSYNIVNVSNGRISKSETVETEEVWQDVWVKVNSGNPEALSSKTSGLAKKSKPTPPPDIELVNRAIDKLAENIAASLCRYSQ